MEQQKIDRIYERLSNFSIDLPRDAAGLGPEFLREAISLCRNYLNETSHYLQDVLIEESRLAMKLDAEEATYELRSTELLATDPRVSPTICPSIADRQAAIDNILRSEKQSILRLRSELRCLGHVKTVVKARQKELNDTMSSIRLQRSLLSDTLRTGGFYGDETTTSRGHGGLDPVDELNALDLEALVVSAEAELEAKTEPAGPPVSRASEPAGELDEASLETLVQPPVSNAPPPLAVFGESDESEEALNAALERFLQEPNDDVASILENI